MTVIWDEAVQEVSVMPLWMSNIEYDLMMFSGKLWLNLFDNEGLRVAVTTGEGVL